VPKGAAKSMLVVADPPTQEEIAEAMKTFALGVE
jgi:periodic tryptophan protein 1